MNKRKIVNDPVHGFIKIPTDFIFDLLEHPYIQRLRRIKQLGLTSFVYPGATHTRFQHALGTVHLMDMAIDCLRQKGVTISDEEAESALAAILLHDIGHGPFSHALEESIIQHLTHVELSKMLINSLNADFSGRLNMAMDIFNNNHPKKFLHQLISGQLDMDRMDYLMRDSFYTGVAEGIIGTERIIKMLNVIDDQLVVESKGIYSIEKFLIARRIMYWQVYFHKTVIAAENLLVKLLQRAKYIASVDHSLFATEAFDYFLRNRISKENINENEDRILDNFIRLDDEDITVSAKTWQKHTDKLLSLLSRNLIQRILPRVRIQDAPFQEEMVSKHIQRIREYYVLDDHEAQHLVFTGVISNKAYSGQAETIKILYNTGEIKDLADASDLFGTSHLTENINKYFLCYPKEYSLNY
ncbi:MAG: HD domain-containing protein [Bacteroidales bacterium]|nr:HD domain-containing protein [Bacteroidales bacterium]